MHSVDEKEAKLPKGECVDELHKLLTTSASNYSPIRIIRSIRAASNNVLMANIDRVIRTLDAFSTRAFRTCPCPNDVLSFKLHYYKYQFEFLREQRKKLAATAAASEWSPVELDEKTFELCIRLLLAQEQIDQETETGRIKKWCRVFEEKYIRESIRQYPYKECALVRQMVTILARTPIGREPSASYVIKSCLHGQKFTESFKFDDDEDEAADAKKRKLLECATCSARSYDAKWCTHCRQVAYCDQFCQRLHWPIHKKQQPTSL